MAEAAQKRLIAFLLEQISSINSELPPMLYHYTSSSGIRSIVSSGVLRANNIGKMNDFAELRYAASVLRAHIDRSFALETDESASKLFSALRRQLTSVDLSGFFALSFTIDGDEIGMWKLYADLGRGFTFAVNISTALKWAGKAHNGLLVRCCYDPTRLDELCRRSLTKIRSIFLEDISADLNPDPDQYSEMYLQNIAWFGPVFKPAVWQDEKEWRFVFVRPPDEHIELEDGVTCIQLPLRVGLTDGVCPIAAICAGPEADYRDDILPLQNALFDRGYGTDFPVHISRHYEPKPGKYPPAVRRHNIVP